MPLMLLRASQPVSSMRSSDQATPGGGWSPIIELRQYTLRPGRRDVLVDLFDSKLVEPQEQAGMKVIGQFRDLDDPDKFVWLRGFRGMTERAESLARFYGGPVWQANRAAANATMVDSDDVLLLRPARPDSAFTPSGDRPWRKAAAGNVRGFVEVTLLHLNAPAEETEIVSFFEHNVAASARESGGSILAYFVTEASKNTFPSLPVREGEQVFVWFVGFHDRARLERSSEQSVDSTRITAQHLRRPPQVLRLVPTSRSLLHGRSPSCRVAADSPSTSKEDMQ